MPKEGTLSIYYDSRAHICLCLETNLWYTMIYDMQHWSVVDLLYFTRQCSDTFKVWWEIWYESCCKFTDESNIEGIFLIGQHFSKLRTNIEWHVFLWLTVYILNITCSGSNLAFIMWNIQQQQQQHVCWLISGWDNSSPYLQRIWANMASLLLWAGHCSGGLLPAKWQISTLVCWHGQ